MSEAGRLNARTRVTGRETAETSSEEQKLKKRTEKKLWSKSPAMGDSGLNTRERSPTNRTLFR